jgi:hypothetical protein
MTVVRSGKDMRLYMMTQIIKKGMMRDCLRMK